MKLTDIQPLEEWEAFEKDIHERFGLNAGVFDEAGSKITGLATWGNRLCPVIKGSDKGRTAICAVANQNMLAAAKNTHKSVVEECDAGLIKFVSPIFVGDTFLGIAGGCGILLDSGEIDAFLINKLAGIEADEIESRASDVDKATRDEVDSMVHYVEEGIDRIVGNFREPEK
jgi:ligand-binding sensor protein